ncbi:MAG: malectin domain-containing carbohydrate-binding protein [Mangrovibacterium sp.]
MKNKEIEYFRANYKDMINLNLKSTWWLMLTMLLPMLSHAQPIDADNSIRKNRNLNQNWETILSDSLKSTADFKDGAHVKEEILMVNVPHNWDDYAGFRREVHGNLHASAYYRNIFDVKKIKSDEHYAIWFEGVGSYATVWLNGDSVGFHAGGRTSFTIDVSKHLKSGKNILVVRADHPASIRNLPWVCGGCSSEWGFCEGSQPLGIFRPVHLITTKKIRIEPFGVHVWNDNKVSEKRADLHVSVDVKNFTDDDVQIRLENRLIDPNGDLITSSYATKEVRANASANIAQELNNIQNPKLWSIENPHLYQVKTLVFFNNKQVDELTTTCGIRWIKWDIFGENPTNRFYLNGKPVFINGTAEYEHLMGRSHAFTDEMVKARVQQVVQAGYNSFRDAHQPHNLLYNKYWDELGVLWWTQMSAHIWFDNDEFKENFKTLLTDWVKERRNSPSVILWGLENESTLPKDFSEECTEIIRQLDPTCSSQRLVTTCNGGEGTDWNVVQNWSGTYGGNPWAYDEELSKQLLNGEYGAWRSIDLHTEGGFDQKGAWSEDRFSLLMESKILLAEKAQDKLCGQYHWLLNSHENPGRTQGGEGLREIDRLGPVNYKGLITPWGEMIDAYYLYRANYIDADYEPMVYIVSHTWADRWISTGLKDTVRVFSNCDEVELFSGMREKSFGKLKNPGRGKHFIFNQIDVQNNLLMAVGYQNGEEVASDVIVLNHLPIANGIEALAGKINRAKNSNSKNYIYRVNCGGADYTDRNGNLWLADVHWDKSHEAWGSTSWTDSYDAMPPFYGSQRQTNDPIAGTLDWKLLQSFRYGMGQLKYHFPLPDGKYQVELYFIEPWYGTAGAMHCKDWRKFSIAFNDEVLIHDLDIWSEVGHDRMLVKTITAEAKGGMLEISFPEVKASQAIISAIAISSKDKKLSPAMPSNGLIKIKKGMENWKTNYWLNNGDFIDDQQKSQFVSMAPKLFAAEWLMPKNAESTTEIALQMREAGDIYIALSKESAIPDGFKLVKDRTIDIKRVGEGLQSYLLYKKTLQAAEDLIVPAFENRQFALLAVVPFTTLDDARDLRPSVSYPAKDAQNIGSGGAEIKWDKEARMVEEDAAIEWVFQTGLASKYGLEIRYSNPSKRDVPARIVIESIDGRPMAEENIILEPSGDRWRSYRTDTGSIINAGTYKLRIELEGKRQIWFNFLKVQ